LSRGKLAASGWQLSRIRVAVFSRFILAVPALMAVAGHPVSAASIPAAMQAAAPAQGLQRQSIDTKAFPLALCNDGSSAVYYWQAGVGVNAARDANKTVIYLGGGGFCASDADCSRRPPEGRSSMSYPTSVNGSGILSSSSKNPNFQSWNRVFLPYCTSDMYSGDTGPTGGAANFQFRGARVVEAMIQSLTSRNGVGKKGDVVLLSGGSAGAVGVFINANRVRALLPAATVLTLVDSGVFPDVLPPESTPPETLPIREQLADGSRYWNSQFDSDCVAANPKTPEHCLLFQYALPTLRTPTFTVQNVRDPVSIRNVGFFQPSDSNTAEQNDWVNQVFIKSMASILLPLGQSAGEGLFAVCEPDVHGMIFDDLNWTRRYTDLGSATLEKNVYRWANGLGARTRVGVSSCRYP